ncbi:MAG: RsmB/NOP family class I SAM-dependent RNA methyltransferase [Cellulomonadaceae bacterium]
MSEQRRNAAGRQRGAVRRPGARSAQAPSQRRHGTDRAREVAFEVLREVDEQDAYANLVLPPAVGRADLHGRDAAFATELAYGTLRLRGRYDAVLARCVNRPLDQLDPPVLDLLRLGAHQLLGMRVPAHAAVSETVGLARQAVGSGSAQFVNAVLRAVSRRPLEDWLAEITADEPDPVERLALAGSHPGWIARALRDALTGHGRDAGELEDLLAADNTAPAVTLVARPGLVSVAELNEEVTHLTHGAASVRPARFAPTAGVLSGTDPGRIPAVRAGAAGVQDEGSQLVTLALTAVPLEPNGRPGGDERWLDLCAGPGGKAALLAAVAGERRARVVANEVAPHRAALVERSLAAVPADAVEEVRTGDGRLVGAAEPAAYDRVLVDAPCTGLGALRRRPESRWRRTPADVAQLTELQRDLLESAVGAVRPGGVVAYVTCSPHLAETEMVVADLLQRRSDVAALDTGAVLRTVAPHLDPPPSGGGHGVQLWPHVHGTDAMYLCLLRRTR